LAFPFPFSRSFALALLFCFWAEAAIKSSSLGRVVRGGVKSVLEAGLNAGDAGGAEPLAGPGDEGRVVRVFLAAVSGVGDEERARFSGDSEGRGRP
jgi:hypothetical protein